jgi:hypothetical protein
MAEEQLSQEEIQKRIKLMKCGTIFRKNISRSLIGEA